MSEGDRRQEEPEASAGDPADGSQAGPLSFGPEPEADAGRRWAHRQDPDLEPHPTEPASPIPPPARPPSTYGWLFGIVVALILAYIGFNTLRHQGSVHGLRPNDRLPPFAVPLAASRLEGDANVATARGQGQSGHRPACTVRGPQILNSCQLIAGAPAVLTFVATDESRCADELDALERARRRFPGVRFAAVAARTDRERLRALIRRRGWHFPIGFDRDGAVFARYGVVDCPTTTFAYPGGASMRTVVKPLSEAQLDALVARLASTSRRRGWTPGR